MVFYNAATVASGGPLRMASGGPLRSPLTPRATIVGMVFTGAGTIASDGPLRSPLTPLGGVHSHSVARGGSAIAMGKGTIASGGPLRSPLNVSESLEKLPTEAEGDPWAHRRIQGMVH